MGFLIKKNHKSDMTVAESRGQTYFKTPTNRQDLIIIYVTAFLNSSPFGIRLASHVQGL